MEPSSNGPTISVGLPVFNGENFVREAIESILSQTYSDFELVISDNASTDSTQSICEEYQQKDKRVRYFRSDENRGASWNFNNTFKLSRGEFFKWAAHDDVLLPRYLEETLRFLKENPDAVLVHSRVGRIENEGTIYKDDADPRLRFDCEDPIERFNDAVYGRHFFTNVFGLMPRSVLANTSLIGSFASSDVVLMGQLALAGKIIEVPEKLFLWRTHKEQSMQKEYHDGDHRAYAYWFNPAIRGKMNFPHWRLLGENLKSVLKADLSVPQKLHGLKIVLTSKTRISGRRQYLLDIVYAFKNKFSSHNS